MTATVPLVNRAAGDLLTTTLWNTYVVANVNKLLNQAHRKVTVAQFAALTGIEDGYEVYLEVDATNGVEWHLVYRTAEATYKWRFLGWPPMASAVATSESTVSASFAALATAGPSITLPRAGDYAVEHGATIQADANGAQCYHSYDIGVTGAVVADAVYLIQPVGANAMYANVWRRKRQTGLTAIALVSKYKTSAGTAYFINRALYVHPVRLRHDA